MQRFPFHPSCDTRRRGSIIIVVLVILLIMTAMAGQSIRRVLLDRRQVTEELQHRQTLELVHAGVRRLRQQYRADPAWAGETWKPSVGGRSSAADAEVVLSIDGRLGTVVARYPIHHPYPIRITQQIPLEEP